MRIAVLGIGRMGGPIAQALATEHRVSAFDPDPGRADPGDGIRSSPTLRDAVEGAEVLVTVLPGAAEFAAALDEIVASIAPGALWIDSTSNDPRSARRAAALAEAAGAGFVSAALTGGPADARGGTLRIAVSGAPSAVARARAVLAGVVAESAIEVVGDDPGDADAVKLLSNLLWFGQVVAVTEAMLLGEALGFAPARLHDLLARGPGSSVLLARDYGAVLDGDYRADFGLDRVVEELGILTALADDHGRPFELSRYVTAVHREALDRYGPIDGELLAARLIAERAGSGAGTAAEGEAEDGGDEGGRR